MNLEMVKKIEMFLESYDLVLADKRLIEKR